MSGKYGVQNPISAGQYLACYNATSVANTDWNNLTSTDFYDTSTGNQLAAGLKFAFVAVYSSNTSSISYIKLRAAAGAGDSQALPGCYVDLSGPLRIRPWYAIVQGIGAHPVLNTHNSP